MKAIDIINFINEDKFSKYTIQQIYDELGEEEFFNYIDSIVRKVIKNIKGLNNAELHLTGEALLYVQKTPEMISILTVTLVDAEFIIVSIKSRKYIIKDTSKRTSKDFTIDNIDDNISEMLKRMILKLCKSVGL